MLKVISSSPGELEPVFNAMLKHAVRICDAGFGVLWLYDGDAFRAGALYHVPDQFTEFWRRGPHPPSPESMLARVVRTKQTVQIADLKKEPGYAKDDIMVVAGVDVARISIFYRGANAQGRRTDRRIGVISRKCGPSPRSK